VKIAHAMLQSVCLLIALSSLSCGQSIISKPQLTFENEAKAKYRMIFERQFIQCGTSYYSEVTYESYTKDGFNGPPPNKGVDIIELKGVSFSAKSLFLSEADRLNGIQWLGRVVVSYTAGRRYKSDKGWEKWENFDFRPTGYSRINHPVDVQKNTSGLELKRDTFDFEYNSDSAFAKETYKKIDCSSIPK
jgi:hypothetical protein